MLTQELPIIDDVSKTVYRVTAEEKLRMELFARQDAIRCANDQRILQERAKKEHEETLAKLSEAKTKLSDTETKLSDTETKLSEAEAEIARLKKLLKEEQ